MPATDGRDATTKREPKPPESTGRVLDTAASDGQRVVDFSNWALTALRMVREILGVTVERNDRVVPDPTETILGGSIRVPKL